MPYEKKSRIECAEGPSPIAQHEQDVAINIMAKLKAIKAAQAAAGLDNAQGKQTFNIHHVAETIMDALCEDGRADMVLLKDDEVRIWWQDVLATRKARADAAARIERRNRIRDEALAKLSHEEREILGISAADSKTSSSKDKEESLSLKDIIESKTYPF